TSPSSSPRVPFRSGPVRSPPASAPRDDAAREAARTDRVSPNVMPKARTTPTPATTMFISRALSTTAAPPRSARARAAAAPARPRRRAPQGLTVLRLRGGRGCIRRPAVICQQSRPLLQVLRRLDLRVGLLEALALLRVINLPARCGQRRIHGRPSVGACPEA